MIEEPGLQINFEAIVVPAIALRTTPDCCRSSCCLVSSAKIMQGNASLKIPLEGGDYHNERKH
jgi:hypothetical protein